MISENKSLVISHHPPKLIAVKKINKCIAQHHSPNMGNKEACLSMDSLDIWPRQKYYRKYSQTNLEKQFRFANKNYRKWNKWFIQTSSELSGQRSWGDIKFLMHLELVRVEIMCRCCGRNKGRCLIWRKLLGQASSWTLALNGFKLQIFAINMLGSEITSWISVCSLSILTACVMLGLNDGVALQADRAIFIIFSASCWTLLPNFHPLPPSGSLSAAISCKRIYYVNFQQWTHINSYIYVMKLTQSRRLKDPFCAR